MVLPSSLRAELTGVSRGNLLMDELRMTPHQMAALVDAALRTRHPLTYFDTAMAIFRTIGRDEDATATAVMGCLYAEGEIERLMVLRAAWRMGRARHPADVVG